MCPVCHGGMAQIRYCIPVGAPELGTVALDRSTQDPIGGAVVPSRHRETVYSVSMVLRASRETSRGRSNGFFWRVCGL